MGNCSDCRVTVTVEQKGRVSATLYAKVGAVSIVVTSDKPKAAIQVQNNKPRVQVEVVDE
jgi:hypothetical protein